LNGEHWEAGIESTIRGVITNCERVKRVLSRDTDARGADTERVSPSRAQRIGHTNQALSDTAGVSPNVRRERRRRQTAISELPEIFKVGKNSQVFIAKIAIKRTVQVFAIRRCDVRRRVGEVEQETLTGNR